MKIFSFILLTLLFAINGNSQNNSNFTDLISRAESIIYDNSENVKFIKFNDKENISTSKRVEILESILNLSTQEQFVLDREEKDQIGYQHYRYFQTYKGVRVEDAIYYVHGKNNRIKSLNGEYYSGINLNSVQPTISAIDAIQFAKHSLQKNAVFDDHIVELPVLRIISLDNKEYKLVYKTDIYSIEPLGRNYIYIDAKTGSILKSKERIHVTDVPGTAHTKYHGTKTITVDSISATNYRLYETGRGKGIHTRDLNTSTSYSSAVDFTDADNVWNTTTNQDDAALDAHFGAEATYDYFSSKFSRDSYDNNGAVINSYVHYSSNYTNAFWDGSRMTYGDGGTGYSALTSLDIVAHEITHAITQNTANLVYSYESGALNESFSDIFGVVLDYEENPSSANYLMGDLISTSGTPFRNMADPNTRNDPDTYLGTYWHTSSSDNGGVHTNSGVQNFWFYLLVNGGSGTNDIGNTYSVSGIDMDDAAKIAYRNLSVYLTTNSKYIDARTYSIQSAIDLFGACSAEVIATTNAWHAVGVGGPYTSYSSANFIASQNYSCNYPVTINFTNTSVNDSTYHWDFGDGDTSILENPSHIYDTTGTYNVTLIMKGKAPCLTIDTIIYTNFITVDSVGGPIKASCTPLTTNAGSFGRGIFNFSFDIMSNTTNGGTDGYKDYSCSHAVIVEEGKFYTLNVTTGSADNEGVKVWIDFNNDGQFNNTNELIFESLNKFQAHSGSILIPGGAVKDTVLRMRVGSDYHTNNLASACTNSINGQFEDYSITIQQNNNPPAVDFIADFILVDTGQTVNFTDLSQNLPSSWAWTFTGANVTTSTLQNPLAVYNTAGTYQVKLVATNSNGSDSLTKLAYITVIDYFTMCTNDSSNSSSGKLYDSGGPLGNYTNSQNCSFLINPTCANSVTLTFKSFRLESCCDYFRVYDGVDNTGALLLTANGSSIPASVTANSGSMFINFTSDGSGTYSGWDVDWIANIPSSDPVANFSISDTTPIFNTPVNFIDSTTNFPRSWLWEFGDGVYSSLQNPSHNYLSSGLKSVTLISDNCYGIDTTSKTLVVQAPPQIQIIPDSLVVTAGCGDSVTVKLTIKNNGLGDLIGSTERTKSGNSGTIIVTGTTMFHGTSVTSSGINQGPDILTFNCLNYTIGTSGSVGCYNSGGTSSSKYLGIQNNLNAGYGTNYQMIQINNSLPLLTAGVPNYDVIIAGYNWSSSIFHSLSEISDYLTAGGNIVLAGGYSGTIPFLPYSVTTTYSTTSAFPSTAVDPTHPLAQNVIYGEWGYSSEIHSVITNYDVNEFQSIFSTSSNVLVVRDGFNGWLDLDSNNFVISPSDSLVIDIDINPSNLNSGVYYDTIYINSNDSLNPFIIVPIEFTVTGQPSISVNPSVLNFGSQQVGSTLTDTVFIDNNGCDSLHISSFVSTDTIFTTSVSNLSLPPFSNDTIYVTSSPTAIATYNDTLFINSNDTISYVLLNSIGLGAPTISYNPDSINAIILGCDDSLIIPLTIYNTGDGDLYVDHNLSMVNSGQSKKFFDGFEDGTYSKWTVLNSSNTYNVTSSNPGSGSKSLSIKGSANRGLEYSYPADTTSYFSMKMRSDDQSGYSNYFMIGNTSHYYGMCYIVHYNTNQYRVVAGSNYYHTISGNAWTHFEIKNVDYINRTFDLYIDGNMVKSNMGFYSSISNASSINLYNYDATFAGYYDDIQIGENINPSWISVNPDSLTVPVLDSAVFDVKFYSAGLNSGAYSTSIILNSNDPTSPFDTIPVNFIVDGVPSIELSDTCLSFGSILENSTISDSVMVFNTGCDTLFVDSIVSSQVEFVSQQSVLYILPDDSVKIHVDFVPTSIGTFNTVLNFYNNAGDTTICLSGIALGAPSISYNPDSINAIIIDCDDSLTIPITIYNTGNGLLNVSQNFSNQNSNQSNTFFDGFEDGTYNNWSIRNSANTYTITSVNPATGTKALSIKGSGSRGLEYNFPADTISYFSVKLKSDDNSSYSNYFMLGNSSYEFGIGYIVHYGSNEYRIYAGNNYTHYTSGSDWTHFEFKNVNYNLKTFDLYIDGNLVFANMNFYRSIINASRINMYNYDATFAGYYDDVQIGENIKPDWISVSPDSLSIPVTDSAIFNVKLYAQGLNSGEYTTLILLNSNDPASPIDTIPVSFIVDGSPTLVMSDTCIDFGSIYQNDQIADSIFIYNLGCDTLFINSSLIGSSEFTSNLISPSYILPDDSIQVNFTFSPLTAGSYSSTIQIINNDIDTTICLNGLATVPPIISLNPNSVIRNISACEDSIIVPIEVINLGGDTLDWSIGAGNFTDDFEAGINNSLWFNITGGVPASTCGSAGGLNSLFFAGSGLRSAITNSLYVPSNAVVNFELKLSSGSSPCEDVDSGEEIVLEYSINGGSNWVRINTYFTHLYSNFTSIQETVPVAAQQKNTSFRWRQLSNSGINYDTWLIDDVVLNFGSSTGSFPSSGLILPGDTTLVNITIQTGSLSPGQHRFDYQFNSNDPANPNVVLPIIVSISNTVCSKFEYNALGECNGEYEFIDLSKNSPLTWLWKFGDGTASKLQNPIHYFKTNGIYNVSLITCDLFGCDTLTKTVYVNNAFGPIMSQCIPNSNSSISIHDITEVKLNTLNNFTSTNNLGYQDFTCTDSTTLVIGTPYSLNIRTGSSANKNIRVWIDLNNDGSFGNNELVNEMLNSRGTVHNSTVMLPPGSISGTPLRMRVASDLAIHSAPKPCLNVQEGEFEDYSVRLIENSLPPTAEFDFELANECFEQVQFSDLSINAPTTWHWDFGDGTTSTLQHPFHTYKQNGLFNVVLTVSNTFGSDTYNSNVNVLMPSTTIDIFDPLFENSIIRFGSPMSNAKSWLWTFDDGDSAFVRFPKHSFSQYGQFNIKLYVTDEYGCGAYAERLIDIAGLGLEAMSNSVDIYPNPNKGSFSIINSETIQINQIEITNALGKIVYSKTKGLSSNNIVNLKHVAAGVYYVKIMLEDEYYIVKKVMVE